MFDICNEILIEILVLCESNIIIDFSLINKKSFNLFVNNKNYIGIRKLKNINLKSQNNDFNNNLDYLDIYNKINKYINLYYSLKWNAKDGHLKVVQFLVEYGMNNYNDVLLQSSYNGHLEIVKYIIEKGAKNINESLILSAKYNKLEVVKFLINNGADIHVDNEYILRYSAQTGHTEIVKYLIENGANIHIDDDYALRCSALYSHLEIVRYLVENGANIHAVGDCALRWSAMKGHFEIVKYLVENGANNIDNALSSSIENNDDTLRTGHLEVIKYLIKNGANIFIENKYIFRNYSEYKHLYHIKNIIKNCNINSDILNKIIEWSKLNNHISVIKFLIINNIVL